MVFAVNYGDEVKPSVSTKLPKEKSRIGGFFMRVTGKLIWPFIFALAFLTLSRVFILGATPAQTLNLPESTSDYTIVDDNDDVPDVTARVARISFIKGDAQIRRADGGDWEKATLNLPIVEGDEITTSGDGRLEIQFDNNQHLRLAENAYLKIVQLKDEGIAISLSLGTMSVTIKRFDKDKAFFEVDAPKTTVAVQKAGVYRIDAGQQGDNDIRVSVTDSGEARVYSDNTGFTLKNNRSALVHIDGANAGEWEAGDTARYSDEFDSWSENRDDVIAQRLKKAFYDKYYDNDIYGADDLNDYGEWVYTAQYGNVWRPYRNVTSYYADWSPYRYGHWRWIPPYGWTWVNDEPWGWATYHHGRWFYDDGFWYWSPYGYYRTHRSWWSPALVVLNIFDNNVCWYPLPYHYTYYNYNYYYNCHRGCNNGGHHGGGHYGGGGHHQPPTGGVKVPHQTLPPKVPVNAVVAQAEGDFGTSVKPVKTAPFAVAKNVLAKKVEDMTDPVLPTYSPVKMSSEIKTTRPKTDIIAAQTKVGAAPRKSDVPLDKELRTKSVFGGREPVIRTDDSGGVRQSNGSDSDVRKTGAVVRQPPVRQNETPPIRQTPTRTPSNTSQDDSGSAPVRTQPERTPVRQPPVRQEPPVRQPIRQEPTRDDTPVRQTPRSEPTPTRQPPRSEPAPTRQPPRSEPTRPQPSRNESKQESKPAPSKAPAGGNSKAD